MTNYKVNASSVKEMARGRWLDILPALASHEADLLTKASKRVGASYINTPCPICGGVDRFGFMKDAVDTGSAYCRHCGGGDGFALLSALNGWTFYQCLQAVNDYLTRHVVHDSQVARAASHVQNGMTSDQLDKRARAIKRIIEGCSRKSLQSHTTYLRSRGLADACMIDSPSLIYHPGLPYYVEGKPLTDQRGKWLTWPAIVGRISGKGGWLGLQKIYITKDGRKATDEIRLAIESLGLSGELVTCKVMFKSCENMTGGAVRIGKAGDTLAVCEGLETGLAVHLMTGLPVAACGTANLMRRVDIPPQVKDVRIYADNDTNGTGLWAAESLQGRLLNECIESSIFMPKNVTFDTECVDWLDEYAADVRNGCVPCYIERLDEIIKPSS